MVNIICEYKHDKNWEGNKIRPRWLDDGGYWFDSDNYAYIGIVTDPEVKVPETVVRFTKESLIERQLDIHSRYPFTKRDPESDDRRDKIELTNEEVTEQVETWWDNNADS